MTFNYDFGGNGMTYVLSRHTASETEAKSHKIFFNVASHWQGFLSSHKQNQELHYLNKQLHTETDIRQNYNRLH